MQETLWKNNLTCVKDITVIRVNFIIIVTLVPEEEKVGGVTYVSNFVNVVSRVRFSIPSQISMRFCMLFISAQLLAKKLKLRHNISFFLQQSILSPHL
jgi:hypothetical protein